MPDYVTNVKLSRRDSGNPSTTLRSGDLSIETTGNHRDAGQIDVTTAGELTFNILSELTTGGGGQGPGYVFVRVLGTIGSGDYLRLGFATGDYKLRVGAGEANLFSLDDGVSQLFMRAVNNDVVVEIEIIER